MFIQTYKNIQNKFFTNEVEIEEYFKWIKNGVKNKSGIEKLRILDKVKNKVEYDNEKKKLECVTLNFLFNCCKKNANVSGPTGLLYIDIDIPKFNIDILDLTKIYAYHLSCGGKGWSIYIKIDNLNLNNYKEVYLNICKELGLTNFIDKGAMKATQFTIISWDPNIYINENPYLFNANNYISKIDSFIDVNAEQVDQYIDLETGEVLDFTPNDFASILQNLDISTTSSWPKDLKFSDATDYIDNEDFLVFKEKVDTTTVFLKKNVKQGSKHNYLCSVCQNILYLNPHLEKPKLFLFMKKVAEIGGIQILEKDLNKIIDNYFEYKNNNTLIPNRNKKRRIIFNKNSKLSKTEKIGISNKENGKLRSENTLNKILECINKGITKQKDIANELKMNISTIRNYWKQIKNK